MYTIINSAAIAYKGTIPADRWQEPYMSADELAKEIGAGVIFWCWEEAGSILGIMGIQDVKDVTLIRHAYTHPTYQRKGIGAKLLQHLAAQTKRPLLMGTWADAQWAIRFYEKHGFSLVSVEEKNILLRKYWSIPERAQVETCVVPRQCPGEKAFGRIAIIWIYPEKWGLRSYLLLEQKTIVTQSENKLNGLEQAGENLFNFAVDREDVITLVGAFIRRSQMQTGSC